jgi:hypothetical protein
MMITFVVQGAFKMAVRHLKENKNVQMTNAAVIVVQQRANSFTGGRAFDPEPRQPLPHSRDWCFAPLSGSGWQVLFEYEHGSIGSEKSDTLQKMVVG